jgi:hypothetical protein
LYDASSSEAEAHRLQEVARIAAAVLAYGSNKVVGGASARFLHRLPEAMQRASPVILLAPERTQSGRGHGVRVIPARVPRHHRTDTQRIPVLTMGRVAVDALRTEDLATALMVGDGALRAGTTSQEIEQVLADCTGWPGVVRARSRLPLLDPRRETPLESASVALFAEHDLPIPDAQVEIWQDGRLVGRADFGWMDRRVLGEADGKTKYVEDLPGAPPPEERVWSQRLRQSDFEDIGFEMVRWTDAERVHQPDRVVRRILRAFERAQRLGLTA